MLVVGNQLLNRSRLPIIGDNANDEHLPGHVFRDARNENGIVASVPAWGWIDLNVAAIPSLVKSRTADKNAVTAAIHRVVVPVAVRVPVDEPSAVARQCDVSFRIRKDIGVRPTTDGKLLALSRHHEQRIEVLDVFDFKNLKLLGGYRLRGHPGACGFWNRRLVIPSGYQGLLVERIQSSEDR